MATSDSAPASEQRQRTTPHVLVDRRLLPKRFLVASNRLPYQLQLKDGELQLNRGAGGLVTALDPILRLTGGTWIGWAANYDPLPERVLLDEGLGLSSVYDLKPLNLSRGEIEQYYLGYSNNCLWPLFHYFQEYCEFNRDHWQVYKEVNRRFAEAIIEEYRDGDLIWIHDYHLLLVPQIVRAAIPDAKIAFFLHIPFPGDALFLVEPHATELLAGLLGSDLIGFQVDSFARSFIDAVSALTTHRFRRSEMQIDVDGRRVKLGSYPISIDFSQFEEMASRENMPQRVADLRTGYRADILAVGVDRLDYSKGILQRLRAIELMLDSHPDIQGRFTFIQISAPSRTKVRAYQDMRQQVEQMVGHINGRFGGRGCIPIDYRYEGHPQEELAAYYRAADLALVTPLRDGMNLVAKEYVASRVDDGGSLVLSRFAGASNELRDAFLVNPYDPETMAERIYEAIMVPEGEKRRCMRRMREIVRRNDIYWWLERFLRDAM